MWIDRRVLLLLGGASLLLNIFLIGLVVGRNVPVEGRRAPLPPVGKVGFVRISHIRQLSPDDRRLFREAMISHRPAIRSAREKLREQRRQTEADMMATTFDRAKVAADLSALREANNLVLQRVHGALLDAVGALPLEGRTALMPQHKPAASEPDPNPSANN